MIKTAYKLLRVRHDKTLGPLFINCRQRIPVGVWLNAEPHRRKGYKFRPGWHCTDKPDAPHLTKNGRAWYTVEISDFTRIVRPKAQGGIWYLAQRMRVLSRVSS